ncbi:MAG: flagellar biosynthetic protein FliQ [Lachnospiraceae bacterium]|nr:flagellar biosynthetic protein FliQ [Lachnospiraceae bacterium]
MTSNDVTEIVRTTLYTVILCSMPMLLVSLVLGLIVSVFQTVTSIQEQTLTFVPKFIGIFIMIMIMGHWIMGNIISLMEDLYNFSVYI